MNVECAVKALALLSCACKPKPLCELGALTPLSSWDYLGPYRSIIYNLSLLVAVVKVTFCASFHWRIFQLWYSRVVCECKGMCNLRKVSLFPQSERMKGVVHFQPSLPLVFCFCLLCSGTSTLGSTPSPALTATRPSCAENSCCCTLSSTKVRGHSGVMEGSRLRLTMTKLCSLSPLLLCLCSFHLCV